MATVKNLDTLHPFIDYDPLFLKFCKVLANLGALAMHDAMR
jgi:hypothetical protein